MNFLQLYRMTFNCYYKNRSCNLPKINLILEPQTLPNMTIDAGTSDLVSQKPYPIAMKHYQWVKEEIEKVACCKSHLHQPLQLFSPHHSSTQRRWRKTFGIRLQSSQQSNKKIHMAHAKSGRHFF